MNFVLTNEKIQERIINKANSGIFEFDNFELEYLKEHKKLIIQLFEKINNSNIPIEKYGFAGSILTETITKYDLLISHEVKEVFLKYCLYAFRVKKELLLDVDLEILDDNQKKVYLNEIRTSIQNKDILDSQCHLTSYLLDIIVETNKYELLNSLKPFYITLSSFQKNKLREYYSSGKELPSFLVRFSSDLEVSKMQIPLDTQLEIYDNHDMALEYNCDITLDDIKNKINSVDNIPSGTRLDKINISEMFNLSRIDTINFLLDKGFIDNILMELDKEEYLELKDKIIMTIKNGAKVNSFPSFMEEDIDLMTVLLETEQLHILFPVYVKPDYEKIDYFLKNNINNFRDKFLELMEKKYSSHPYRGSLSPVAEKILLQAVYNGKKIKINESILLSSSFLNTLIENKKFDELYFQINNCSFFVDPYLSDKAMKIIKEEMNSNQDFIEKFFLNNLNKSFIENIITNDLELRNYFLKYSEFSLNLIMNNINHQEENENNYTKELYDSVKEYYISKYGLNNSKHLDYLVDNFGYMLIRYIDNENIINLINLPDDKFDKIVNLFGTREFTQTNAETIFDSIIQYKFRYENEDIVNIFPNIMHSIADKDTKYIELIAEIIKNLDDNFFKKYPQFNEIKGYKKEFMGNLIKYIGSDNTLEQENAINILHIFTDYYIANQREKYASKFDIRKKLGIPYEYDEKDLAKTYGKRVVLTNLSNKIIRELTDKYDIDYDLARDIIFYYQGVYKFSPERENEIIPNIKYLVKVLDEFVNNNCSYQKMVDEMPFLYLDNVKKKYIYDRKEKNFLAILRELDVNSISNKLLDGEHDKEYESLLATMQKYRLHLLPEYFDDILNEQDIFFNADSITAFIEYYYKIYEREKKKLESLGKVPDKVLFSGINTIKTATIYASNSSVYSILFGKEDARLIKYNPNPNSSSYTSKERLSTSVNYMIKNYQRDKVCIPTFNEEISFSSDNGHSKKMRVIVGNFTNPCNLTHGERTGACMRIGGAGSTLYDFCLSNKCGFHIRFEAENGEYISRVSGFRNGNTVFLNELRCSCNTEKYSDQDVVSACKEVSKKIIEISKESEYPIDNVVIHKAYAMNSVPDKPINLEIAYGDNKRGFDNDFYSDINNSGIILASTDKPFAPIKFETEKLPEYLPARDIPYKGKGDDKLIEIINRVHSVKEVLDGKDYREVDETIPLDEIILYGVANNDYYVYVNANGEVHDLLIDNDKRAIAEFEQAKEEVASYMIDNNIFMENQHTVLEKTGKSK